ncbi:MAG: efflux RND transporter periplasmic adaptor subunit [Myxococcales bacterium]|nr:efflux RND transporter periplasmic adaptor subunit [Myxococcales bacterium]
MNTWARMVAPLLVLGLGTYVAWDFMRTAPQTRRVAVKSQPPLVTVEEVRASDRQAQMEVLGSVRADREVTLQPEVSGTVRYVHEALEPGGLVKAGEVLLRIDARNYRLAVNERRASVARSQADLDLELGQQRVAQKEWDMLQGSMSGEADERLALRQPQLENAKAALAAAEAALARAQLDLSRTVIRAPFDAFVQSEAVERGQLVGQGSVVATLVGTEAFWVQVSMPLEDMPQVLLPQKGASGSTAWIRQPGDTKGRTARPGEVVHLLGDLDPQGKMARLMIRVQDPLTPVGGTPLLIGSIVQVVVAGRMFTNIFEIPRLALRDGGAVWLVEEGKLKRVPVDVVWKGRETVFVLGELGEHFQLINSRLSTPVDGMAVRVEGAPPMSPENSLPSVDSSAGGGSASGTRGAL